MFNFRHFAIACASYCPNQQSKAKELEINQGDLILIHHEYENGLGWSLAEKVNKHYVKESGCRLYDPNYGKDVEKIGFIPSGFVILVKLDPEKFDPDFNIELFFEFWLKECQTQSNTGVVDSPFGIQFYRFEIYYRDQFKFKCHISLKELSTNIPKMHCTEYGNSYENYNFSLEEYIKKDWKSITLELINKPSISVPLKDIFFVRITKHPAQIHWLFRTNYVAETLNNAFLTYEDRPSLGFRRKLAPYTFEDRMTWFTFAQLHERLLRFGNGLRTLYVAELFLQKRKEENELGKGFIGLCSGNRVDWFVSDWAVLCQGIVSIALPKAKVEGINEDIFNFETKENIENMKVISHEIIQIVGNSEVPMIVTSRELLVKFLKLIKVGLLPSVKTLIQMDDFIVSANEVSEYTNVYNLGDEEKWKSFLKEKRRQYLNNLKQVLIHQQQTKEGGGPHYYLIKERYNQDIRTNLNACIENLVDFTKDEFILLNHIDEHDFELDWKARVLAQQCGVELNDMITVENSSFKKFPTFNDELKVSVTSTRGMNDICTIVYTSGSTSTEPKGAIMTDKNYNQQLMHELWPNHPLVSISFSPLSHITDRTNTTITLMSGGRTGIYCGDMEKIFDDFRLIQPITLSTTPRFYNMLYAEYQKYVKKRESENLPEPYLMSEFKNILGGRMTSIVTGGASTSPDVINWLRQCFKIPVYNGYASTECGSISWVDRGDIDNMMIKEEDKLVNEQLPKWRLRMEGVDIKVESIPELNYLITDEPYSRGEICVKSDKCIVGYYRDPEKTKELIDDEGYYRTGDIGEIDKVKLKVRVIDRKKNIFKLAQGEFVAPEVLENLFISRSDSIDQMFMYGNSFKNFLVAVIVPKNLDNLKQKMVELAANQNVTLNAEDPIDTSRNGFAYKVIQQEINKIAKESKLQSYEVPRAFIIDLVKFTPDNGLLTASQKTCRPALNKHYRNTLEQLYDEVEKEVDIALSGNGDLRSTLENLLQNGSIDSLGAVRLSNFLRENYNVLVRADQILLYGNNTEQGVDNLMKIIETAKQQGNQHKLRFNSTKDLQEEVRNLIGDIHWTRNTVITEKPKIILLTGATGFIGCGLLCELLMSNDDTTVYCIARGTDCRKRIIDTALQYAHNLSVTEIDLLNDAFENRFIAINGDLSQPQFGLNDSDWIALGKIVDGIIHCGATVNFIMNYDQLRDVNVKSVVECLKLSVMGEKLKPLHFVSTISVIPQDMLNRSQQGTEDIIPLDYLTFDKLYSGYPQSKYVAEHVLKLAIEERNIKSIVIHRPGLVVGHSINGYANVREWISRLICGIIHLGVAPSNSNHKIHMVPVDFISKSIVGIFSCPQFYPNIYSGDTTKNIFNLINVHNDNPKSPLYVNDLVQYIIRFGYKIKTIPYSLWAKYLHDEMNNLPKYKAMTKDNTIFSIVDLFPTNYDDIPSGSQLDERCDCSNLKNSLSLINSLRKDNFITCPLMNDEDLIVKYIKYFIRSGEIDPPLNE
ncbi:hypothetical protein ABK040_004426 [Willaertia magna]